MRPSGTDLALGFEYLKHGLLLGIVLSEVPEDGLILWVVLADPFQAAFDTALDVCRIEGQTEIEHFGVVAVIVAYRTSALEHLRTHSSFQTPSFSRTEMTVKG